MCNIASISVNREVASCIYQISYVTSHQIMAQLYTVLCFSFSYGDYVANSLKGDYTKTSLFIKKIPNHSK